METLKPSTKELTYLLLLSLGSIATGLIAIKPEWTDKIMERIDERS